MHEYLCGHINALDLRSLIDSSNQCIATPLIVSLRIILMINTDDLPTLFGNSLLKIKCMIT